MLLTIDSSVWIAAFMDESHTKKADMLVRECLSGTHQLITPIIVPLEVLAAMQRQSRDASFAEEVYKLIMSLPRNELVELDFVTARMVKETIKTTGLKANDAFILTVCRESRSYLVTLDEELVAKASSSVAIWQW